MVFHLDRDIPAAKSFVTIENETTERRREDDEEQEGKWSWVWKALAVGVGTAAATALLAWGVSRLLTSGTLSALFRLLTSGTLAELSGLFPSDPQPEPGWEEEEERKKMKQPGRKGKVMYRDDFEANPTAYFRVLHQEKKNNKW